VSNRPQIVATDCGTLIVGSGLTGVPRGPLTAWRSYLSGPRGRGLPARRSLRRFAQRHARRSEAEPR